MTTKLESTSISTTLFRSVSKALDLYPPLLMQKVQDINSSRIRIAALLEKRIATVGNETFDATVAPSSCTTSHPYLNKCIRVCGWSRTIRVQRGGKLCFIQLNDGSTPYNLQILVEENIPNFTKLLKLGVGTSFQILGEFVLSPAKGQFYEVSCNDPKVHSIEILGSCDPTRFPLSKKHHTKEYLRGFCHLRPRTQLVGAITRIRSHLARAIDNFFFEKGFLRIHTPVLTSTDCEGAGEMFQVTTLLSKIKNEAITSTVDAKSKTESIKRCDEEKETSTTHAEKVSEKVNSTPLHSNQCQESVSAPIKNESTESTVASECKSATTTNVVPFHLNSKNDFFGTPTFLTVSGQLAIEAFCCSLSDVYTFGPTFRAEISHTSKHLAEFWMVEPELAFADIHDTMQCAQECVQYCILWCLQNCLSDLEYLQGVHAPQLVQQLEDIVRSPFQRITYTEAIEKLEPFNLQFEEPVYWGVNLSSEHERFLCESIYKAPIVVYNYPSDLKAFYMKQNDDGKTVAAMDLLVPKIGELVGGSQREDNLETLDQKLKEKKLDTKNYEWYRQLRMYGSITHSGFGLGFERLVMMVTGCENIKDVIAYPRYVGRIEY